MQLPAFCFPSHWSQSSPEVGFEPVCVAYDDVGQSEQFEHQCQVSLECRLR